MGREFHFNSKLLFIILLNLIIVISCVSPYYASHEAFNSYRVRKSEDISGSKNTSPVMINSMDMNFYALESINPQAAFDDILLLLLNNKLIIFDILPTLLLLYYLYRYFRRRNIMISQVKNKFYMVHCLQLKDGKKGMSYRYCLS